MPSRRPAPPWNYLLDASLRSLESYELSRLNHAANTRREITALIEQWVEDTANALLARYVREERATERSANRAEKVPREPPQQPELPFADSPMSEQALRRGRSVRLARRSGEDFGD